MVNPSPSTKGVTLPAPVAGLDLGEVEIDAVRRHPERLIQQPAQLLRELPAQVVSFTKKRMHVPLLHQANEGNEEFRRAPHPGSHINKLYCSTWPFLASLGVVSYHCLTGVLPLSYQWGVWNWPKTTYSGVHWLFLTTHQEARF